MSQQGTEEELAAEVGADGARPEEASQASESSIGEASQASESSIGEASQASKPSIGEAPGQPPGEAPEEAAEPSTGELTEDPAEDADAPAGEAPEAALDGPEEGGDQDPSGPAREVTDGELERELSALLLASPDPLSIARLRKLLGVGKARVEAALLALGERLRAAGLPWELRPIGGGWQLYTTPDMVDTVSMLSRVRREEKVSPAALETLAVVAYRQPVTKAEIEAIRGVQVGPVLRTLVDRGLLKIAGRAEVPGSPLLYGTTPKFLDAFGLMQIDDLPRDAELIKD